MQAEAMSFDKKRTALVFIEFQQEWIGDNGFLKHLLVKDLKPYEKAIKNASSVLKVARKQGWNIAHAGLNLSQDPNYLIFGQGNNKMGLRSAIPKAGTWAPEGSRFVEPFVPQEEEYVVQGRSGASVLKNSTLDAYLRNNDINTVILMGFALHVCVESSLREAHDLGYNAYVATDASGAFETAQSDYFKKHILHHFGEEITTQELLKVL